MAKSKKVRKTREEIEHEIMLSTLFLGYDDYGQSNCGLIPSNGYYDPLEESRYLNCALSY